MARINTLLLLPAALIGSLLAKTAKAQVSVFDENRRGSLYFNIGTSSPSYKSSTIHINQTASGNNYDLKDVNADNSSSKSTGILSLSFRAGYLFNYNQSWGVELSYDPLAYHVTDQAVHVQGTIDGAAVSKDISFTKANGYAYYLDGANFLSVNLVHRFGIFRNKQRFFAIDLYAKAGAGPAMPHVYNTINGKTNETPQFQTNGWALNGELAARVTIVRHFSLEVAPKYIYANYNNVNVYNGTADQKLKVLTWTVSLGYAFSTTKHNPLFEKPAKSRRVLTIKRIYPDEPVGE